MIKVTFTEYILMGHNDQKLSITIELSLHTVTAKTCKYINNEQLKKVF